MYNNRDDAPAAEPRTATQAVERALSILVLLAQRGPSGATELARELGVHKSTVSRLMTTMEKFRFVEQVGSRGKFQLGFGIVRLAGATAAQLDIAREGRAVCARLAAELRGTVSISVLDGGGTTTVAQEPSTERNWIGLRLPLHATASGKILLANFRFEEFEEALRQPLPRFTENTIVSRAALTAELTRVRDRGWATARGEFETAVHSVAVPVRGPRGRLAGALSITTDGQHLRGSELPAVAAVLGEAAEEILARLQQLAGP